MKNKKKNLLILLVNLIGCSNYAPIKKETCIYTGDELACHSYVKGSYLRGVQKGDICTNPRDYEKIIREYIDSLERAKK